MHPVVRLFACFTHIHEPTFAFQYCRLKLGQV
ncbi:hypothetical protein T01_6381 [Trichinella spiralis]|uniref:Uncharacterized protein n=1 Tax=Trichinella spiralis TaxID=6334 RepID=A0A0V1AGU1_TRISP|nr:hypothetical protein T01_3337 [Trichinella spiralis]KRY23564.1 hypothetical protein T01_6381 [Trichinella spiralis]